MELKKLVQMSRQGQQEALVLGLDKAENWTPLLVHLHTSRMAVGLLLGGAIGFLIGIMVTLVAGC